MMSTRSPDRVWLIGGAVAAALLVAVTWFVLVSPQRGQQADLRAQTATTQDRIVALRQRLAELRRENAKLTTYKALLDRRQAALPTGPDLSAFLRQVQAAGDAAAVTVGNVTVGLPAAVTGDPKAYAMQVAVSATGTSPQLGAFLDQMQLVQPRAVLITSVNTEAGATGSLTLTLTMQVFEAQLGAK
jgi:Tfp pilus assembly protein PilO